MQTELDKIETLMYETLSFVGTVAVYKGELPTVSIGKVLHELERILPRATVNALRDAAEMEIKLKAAQGISPEKVVEDAMKLSKIAEQFGKELETANELIFNAVKNSVQQRNAIEKKERSQQDILDHFNIKINSGQHFNNSTETNKEQKLNL